MLSNSIARDNTFESQKSSKKFKMETQGEKYTEPKIDKDIYNYLFSIYGDV